MRARTAGFFLVAVVGALAHATPMVAREGVVDLPLHSAARFLSALYRTPLVVVGGDDRIVHVELTGQDVAAAAGRLAEGAGLVARAQNGIWVIAPADVIGRLEGAKRGLPAGKRVDLDLERVDFAGLASLLAQALGLRHDGVVEGNLTVAGKGIGAITLTTVVSRLAGHEASRHDRRLVLSGAVPSAPTPPTNPPCAPGDAAANEVPSVLACVDLSSVAVGAWGTVAARSAAALWLDRTPAFIVEPSTRVGAARSPVRTIDARGVTLEDGTLLTPRDR